MTASPTGADQGPLRPQPVPELAVAPPMKPQELDQVLALDAAGRGEWMLEELARWEQAWGLENAEGWVVFELAEAPPVGKPWALPLWPRQELAALASRGAGESPRAIPLDSLLEDLLPVVKERAWQVLLCPGPDGSARVEEPQRFILRANEAWDEYHNEEA